MRMDLPEAAARVFPSGPKAIERMRPAPAEIFVIDLPDIASHSQIEPSVPPVAICFPSRDRAM